MAGNFSRPAAAMQASLGEKMLMDRRMNTLQRVVAQKMHFLSDFLLWATWLAAPRRWHRREINENGNKQMCNRKVQGLFRTKTVSMYVW